MRAPAGEDGVSMGFVEPNIIEARYRGHVHAAMADEVNEWLAELLRFSPGAHWLIDATELSTMDMASTQSRVAVFRTFKILGGGEIAAAVRSPSLRMLSAAFSFGFGLKIECFATRDEALEYLRALS